MYRALSSDFYLFVLPVLCGTLRCFASASAYLHCRPLYLSRFTSIRSAEARIALWPACTSMKAQSQSIHAGKNLYIIHNRHGYIYIHTCMYICKYIYVCVYVCMHVGMYACTHVGMYACRHACMHGMHACRRTYVRTYVCMYVYIYIWIHLICSLFEGPQPSG